MELQGANRARYLDGYNSAISNQKSCDASLLNDVKQFAADGFPKNSEKTFFQSNGAEFGTSSAKNGWRLEEYTDLSLCHFAIDGDGNWEKDIEMLPFVEEAKDRGLACGTSFNVVVDTPSSTNGKTKPAIPDFEEYRRLTYVIGDKSFNSIVGLNHSVLNEAHRTDGMIIIDKEACKTTAISNIEINFSVECPSGYSAKGLIQTLGEGRGEIGKGQDSRGNSVSYRMHPNFGNNSANRGDFLALMQQKTDSRKDTFGDPTTTLAARIDENKAFDESLLAAQRKALQLEQELAALKASKAEDELKIAWDDRSPTINVDSRQKDEATVVVFGIARDNTGVVDLLVNNDAVPVAADGSFETSLYIPPDGLTVEIVTYDQREMLQLKRSTMQASQEARFAQLQPSLGKRGLPNKNALALIVGIENYENLPARPSIHADNDAEYFSDFEQAKVCLTQMVVVKNSK